MKKILRILLVLGIISAYVFSVIPVYAMVQPTTIQINTIDAYKNVLELNDMAISVGFSVGYADDQTETITDTFNVRLMNSGFGGTEILSLAPYTFYNNGFSDGTTAKTSGLVWMYFTAAEVTAGVVTWGDAYVIKLEGNPTISWADSIIPKAGSVSMTSGSYHTTSTISATEILITNYILQSAGTITQAWNNSSYVLTTTTGQNGIRLSSTGQAYFTVVVPNLLTIAPDAFQTSSQALEIYTNPATPNSAAQGIATDFTGYTYITGTVTLTNGSKTVTGNSTAWTAEMATGKFVDVLNSTTYDIESYSSATQITLKEPYGGANGSGKSYKIHYSYSALGLNLASEALHVWGMGLGILLCVGITLFVMVHGCKEANSYKPAILIVLPMLYLFTRLGWFPMGITVGLGLFAAFGLWYVFFYSQTNQ